jgi:hypothetical protein
MASSPLVHPVCWFTHRRLYRLTGGRAGLWRPKRNGWGAMRLTKIGRWTGQERSVMVGNFQDGPNLVTMAMNGWGEGEPAWWLNLQAHPDARVDPCDGLRQGAHRVAKCVCSTHTPASNIRISHSRHPHLHGRDPVLTGGPKSRVLRDVGLWRFTGRAQHRGGDFDMSMLD